MSRGSHRITSKPSSRESVKGMLHCEQTRKELKVKYANFVIIASHSKTLVSVIPAHGRGVCDIVCARFAEGRPRMTCTVLSDGAVGEGPPMAVTPRMDTSMTQYHEKKVRKDTVETQYQILRNRKLPHCLPGYLKNNIWPRGE